MKNATKPSITRLARSAGVKSVSDECYNIIRQLIDKEMKQIIKLAMVVNSEHQTKTLMSDDVYDAISLHGKNLAQSNALSTTTCLK